MLRGSLLIALLTIAAAVPAAAQITPPPDVDTPIIQLGSFGINPTLLLRDVGRDENVFNDRDDPKSDFTFTVLPRVEVLFKPRNARIAFKCSSAAE